MKIKSLSSEQQAVINARKRTLEIGIQNSKILSERMKNIDYGMLPQPEDTRSFAEIQADEVLKRERLVKNCAKLLKSNSEGNKLVTLLNANGLNDFFLEYYSQIFKKVNTDKNIETALPALNMIKLLANGFDQSMGIDNSIIGLIDNAMDEIQSRQFNTSMGAKEARVLQDMLFKLDAYKQVLVQMGGRIPVNSDLPTKDDIEELLGELRNNSSNISFIGKNISGITRESLDEQLDMIMKDLYGDETVINFSNEEPRGYPEQKEELPEAEQEEPIQEEPMQEEPMQEQPPQEEKGTELPDLPPNPISILIQYHDEKSETDLKTYINAAYLQPNNIPFDLISKKKKERLVDIAVMFDMMYEGMIQTISNEDLKHLLGSSKRISNDDFFKILRGEKTIMNKKLVNV